MLNRVGSPGFPTPIEYRRRLAGIAYDRAFRPRGTLRQTQAILSTGSFEDLLPQIRVPTQIVHGLADPLLRPACGQRSAALIRNARLELIPGMGHDLAPTLMPRWAVLIKANAARA
jgi:pimeloyl-ACP methyl ester carboxylesterase